MNFLSYLSLKMLIEVILIRKKNMYNATKEKNDYKYN